MSDLRARRLAVLARPMVRAVRLILRTAADSRVQDVAEGAALAGETFVFLPVAVIAVGLLHRLVGPGLSLVVVMTMHALVRRPSVRAMCWIAGGLYVAAILISAASATAEHAVEPVAGFAEAIASVGLYAAGLAAAALTFVLPLARGVSRRFPDFTKTATTWITELGKGGLAGASIGAALGSFASPGGTFTGDPAAARIVVISLVTTIGIVIGALRADGQVRAQHPNCR